MKAAGFFPGPTAERWAQQHPVHWPLGERSSLFAAVLSVITGRLRRVNERANTAVRTGTAPHPKTLVEQDRLGYLAGEFRRLQADVEALVVALRPMCARTFNEARANEDQRIAAQRDGKYPPPEMLWCRVDALNPCWEPSRPYTGKHWGWTPDMDGDGAVCEECRLRAALAKFGGAT